jgi:hypothetical protein
MTFWKAVRVCWDISGSNVGYYKVYCLLDCTDVLFALETPTLATDRIPVGARFS